MSAHLQRYQAHWTRLRTHTPLSVSISLSIIYLFVYLHCHNKIWCLFLFYKEITSLSFTATDWNKREQIFLGRGVVGVGWATKLTYVTIRKHFFLFEGVLSIWSLYTTVGQLYEIRSGEYHVYVCSPWANVLSVCLTILLTSGLFVNRSVFVCFIQCVNIYVWLCHWHAHSQSWSIW